MKEVIFTILLFSSISAYSNSIDELEDYCWEQSENSAEICKEQKKFLSVSQEFGNIDEIRSARMALRNCQKAAVRICVAELLTLK